MEDELTFTILSYLDIFGRTATRVTVRLGGALTIDTLCIECGGGAVVCGRSPTCPPQVPDLTVFKTNGLTLGHSEFPPNILDVAGLQGVGGPHETAIGAGGHFLTPIRPFHGRPANPDHLTFEIRTLVDRRYRLATEFRVPALGFIERCICCEDDREVCAENPDCGNWPFEVDHFARMVFRLPLDPEADWNSLAAALAGLTKRPAERCGYIHRDLPRFDFRERDRIQT